MIKSGIEDGEGTGQKAKVSEGGRLHVVVEPRPPIEPLSPPLPLARFLRDSNGSNDMRVNGSVNPVDFYIEASPDFDYYVKTLSVLIADNAPSLQNFGALPRLTNGVAFVFTAQDLGELTLEDTIKSNFEFIRIGLGAPAFGSSTNAYQASNVLGNSDAYTPVLDLRDTFGLEWGLRLRKGSKDRVVLRVQDNLTGLDAFNVQVFGVQVR